LSASAITSSPLDSASSIRRSATRSRTRLQVAQNVLPVLLRAAATPGARLSHPGGGVLCRVFGWPTGGQRGSAHGGWNSSRPTGSFRSSHRWIMRLSYSSYFLVLTTRSTPLCQVISERIPEEIRFPQQKLLNNDSLATAGGARVTSGARIAGVARGAFTASVSGVTLVSGVSLRSGRADARRHAEHQHKQASHH